MRIRAKDGRLAVQAVAGTDVVMLGMDLDADLTSDLLGFAIRRTDHTEGQRYWLRNQLGFRINGTSSSYSSWDNPIQTFRWGDYTAKPGHDYTYEVRALGGTPARLAPVAVQQVRVQTMTVDAGVHGVVFNRGVIASQYYAERFGNKQPDQIANGAAYTWLSAGLVEALTAFIGQAAGAGYSLRAAVYEFSWQPVLQAFGVAAASGADVRIVADWTGSSTGPRDTTDAAVTTAGIAGLVIHRTHIAIAHNKFIVLLKDGAPVSVWTGSTNVTEGGLYGQSNVGHIVRDPAIAARYLDYWNRLVDNPLQRDFKPWNDTRPAMPIQRLRTGTTTVFSPRTTVAALDWYGTLADRADSGLFLTAAFGVSAPLMAALTKDRDFLKYVLLDTDSGGAELMIRDADPDNQVTVGAVIGKGGWGQWIKEVTLAANKHVRYIHTKFLLIDPLSDDPIVVTGSANFSKASTISNDENMLVIRGDTDVADVYLTEFMRLFTHYEFRARVAARPGSPGTAAPTVTLGRRYLDPTSHWVQRWYAPGSARAKERQMFAGSPVTG